MSYLKNDNNKVTVDAILTSYGKQKLAATGKLDIYSFAVSDDEIDYALYNSSNDMGSDFYNYAIVNMPTLQPLPGTAMTMKYFLYTADSFNGISYDIALNFDYSITGSYQGPTLGIIGGTRYDTSYAIGPSVIPETDPTTLKNIFYVAYATTTADPKGAGFRTDPIIDPNIGFTPAMQAMQDQFAKSPTGKYYVIGHSFKFKAITPPKSDNKTNGIYINLNIQAYGISSKPNVIHIFLPNTANAVGYNVSPQINPLGLQNGGPGELSTIS